MYGIEITYDTGDSFHQEHDVKHMLGMTWKNMDKAKQALKDIEDHYKVYMICSKEWNAGKNDIQKARRKAMKSPWCSCICEEKSSNRDYWQYSLLLENDEGERVDEHCAWVGYFESLVGADIVEPEDKEMSFRIR